MSNSELVGRAGRIQYDSLLAFNEINMVKKSYRDVVIHNNFV